jgi:acetylornithine/N-succinyldiaminopimelate aminotransferase
MAIRQLFLDHVGQTSDYTMGIEVSHASGVYVYSPDGKRYLDFDSGISVSSLGHSHPAIVAAVQDQAARYMHTMVYGEHIQLPQVAFASALAEILGKGLDNVYYTNCGTEAVEVALKLARKATSRYEIVAAAGAYHGSTMGSESLRSDIEYTQHFVPAVPGVRHIRFNHLGDLQSISCRTAAVIMEPVQAEGGVILPDVDYLRAVAERCRFVGALFILDEIQTGFGRTGTMFAYQPHGIKPDILLIAKAMGGGMPIGAMVTSKNLMGHLARNPMLGHITTFGGHPVCVAAAYAALKIYRDTDLVSQVSHKEALLRSLLVHPLIKSIRSAGLLMAVQLTDEALLIPFITAALDLGLMVDYFLFNTDSFRIAPPLIITEDEIREGVSMILEILDRLQQ